MEHFLNPWVHNRVSTRRDSLPGSVPWRYLFPENTDIPKFFVFPLPIEQFQTTTIFFTLLFLGHSLFMHSYAIPHNHIYGFPVLFAFSLPLITSL